MLCEMQTYGDPNAHQHECEARVVISIFHCCLKIVNSKWKKIVKSQTMKHYPMQQWRFSCVPWFLNMVPKFVT